MSGSNKSQSPKLKECEKLPHHPTTIPTPSGPISQLHRHVIHPTSTDHPSTPSPFHPHTHTTATPNTNTTTNTTLNLPRTPYFPTLPNPPCLTRKNQTHKAPPSLSGVLGVCLRDILRQSGNSPISSHRPLGPCSQRSTSPRRSRLAGGHQGTRGHRRIQRRR